MPTTKSAMKRQRQTISATALNKSKKSRITSAKRNLDNAIHAGDYTKAESARRTFCSALDKGAKAGVISPNKADRGKARSARAVSRLQA